MGRFLPNLLKRRLVVLGTIIGLLTVPSGSWLALAQDTNATPQIDPIVIIVVDFQGVVRRSSAARSIQEQVGAVQQSYQSQYQDLEVQLRGMENELAELRGTLSEDEFVVRRQEFEREVTERQREAQFQRTRLDEALNQSMALVRSTALEVIAEFADEAGAGLVLNKADIILSNRDLDRTSDVLDELNRRLPTVNVDVGTPDGEEAETPE